MRNQRTKTQFSRVRLISCAIILLLIPVWLLIIVPNLTRIPGNFRYTADITSVDNFFNENTQDFTGEQYSKTQFSYEVVGRQNDILRIKNTFDVKSEDGKQIYKAEPIYSINAFTGAQVQSPDGTQREGYLFAPRNLKKTDKFSIWTASGNYNAKMEYESSEQLYGLEVYKYSSKNTEFIDQTQNLNFIPGVGTTRGIKLQPTTTVWVEPVTGWLVKLDDSSLDYYFYDLKTGDRLSPYNQFRNTFTESSVKSQAAYAQFLKNYYSFLSYGVPLFLILTALLTWLWQYPAFSNLPIFRLKFLVTGLTFLVFALLAYTAYIVSQNNVARRLNAELTSQSESVAEAIDKRLELYVDTLYAARAFFETEGDVSREEWQNYIATSKALNLNPGILGFGYAEYITSNERAALTTSVRKEGFGSFAINPEGERPIYTPIKYLEPFNEVNQRAFGYDMLSEANRRRALIRARDTGEPAATAQVTLRQNNNFDSQPGFLIYMPVYKPGLPISTIQERQKAIRGYVYTPIQITSFLNTTLASRKESLEIHAYDGLSSDDTNKIFDSHEITGEPEETKTPFFKNFRVVTVAGHPWTIQFMNLSNFEKSPIDRFAPPSLGIFFLLVGVLTSALVYMLFSSRERSMRYANKLTQDLQLSKLQLNEQNARLQEKVTELNRTNSYMTNRELKMIELKNQIKALNRKREVK